MSFYNKGKGFDRFFISKTAAVVGESDIRAEVSKIIHDESRGSVVVYRRARRDPKGNPILATATRETRSSEALFKNNEGMRYLFDDHLIKGYISIGQSYHAPGQIKTYGDSRTDNTEIYLEAEVLSTLYNDSFTKPDEHDQMIIPEYDIEGILRSPLAIEEMYDITSVEDYRLDGVGRVEFFKINVKSKFDKSNRL
jgi:hypothetical protein